MTLPIACYHCGALIVNATSPHRPTCPVPELIAFVVAGEARERDHATSMQRADPFDHNGECRYCDEQGMHTADCPWIVLLVSTVAQLTEQAARMRVPLPLHLSRPWVIETARAMHAAGATHDCSEWTWTAQTLRGAETHCAVCDRIVPPA